MYSVLLTTVISFLFCLLLTPIVRGLFFRWGIVDRPDGGRKLHKQPVPRVGGIPILASYAVSYIVLMLSPLKAGDLLQGELPLVAALMPAAAAMFLTGLVDDLRGVRPGLKLAGQLAAATLAYWGGVRIASVAGIMLPEWLCLPLTLVWLVCCANAFNLIDGVDGLATGLGLLTTLTIFVAALIEQNTPLALATAPLAGCLLGFLRYNFNPASIFLGDSGSLSVGFLLGCYGVIWSQKSATLVGMTAPLMALAVPLLDTTVAILRRFLRGRPIFDADRGHMHHRLLERGLTPRGVTLLLYAACGVAAALSLVTTVVTPPFAGVALVAFVGAAWLGIHHLGFAEFTVARRAVFSGEFQNLVNYRLSIDKLRQAIARAEDPESCWNALERECEGMGLSHVYLRIAGRSFRSSAMEGPVRPSWYAYVPLSESDHVLLGRSGASEADGTLLGPLMDVVQRSLRARLPDLTVAGTAARGQMEPTESLLRLFDAVQKSREDFEPEVTPASSGRKTAARG